MNGPDSREFLFLRAMSSIFLAVAVAEVLQTTHVFLTLVPEGQRQALLDLMKALEQGTFP